MVRWHITGNEGFDPHFIGSISAKQIVVIGWPGGTSPAMNALVHTSSGQCLRSKAWRQDSPGHITGNGCIDPHFIGSVSAK